MKFDDTAAPLKLAGQRFDISDFTADEVATIRACTHQIGLVAYAGAGHREACLKCGVDYLDLATIDPNWQQRTKMNDTADNVTPIRKTDEAIAAEIRAELTPILDAAAAVMNKGRAAGLTVNFGMGLDAYGRYKVTMLDILKPL